MIEYTTCHYCEQIYPKETDGCPYCGEQIFDIEILREIARSILRDNQQLKKMYYKGELALMLAYGKYCAKDHISQANLGPILADALCELWGQKRFFEWAKTLEKT